MTPWHYNSDQKQMTGCSFQIDLSVVNKMHMLQNELLWAVIKETHTVTRKFTCMPVRAEALVLCVAMHR